MRIPSNDSILSDGEMVGSPPPALNRLSRHGLNPSNSLMRKSLHASSPGKGYYFLSRLTFQLTFGLFKQSPINP